MNTTNPEKLKKVVKLLSEKKLGIDSYFEAYIFKPYNIDIKKLAPFSEVNTP